MRTALLSTRAGLTALAIFLAFWRSALAQGGAQTALSFDGADDAVIRTNVVGLPTGNSPHTIEAWVKINEVPIASRYWLLLLGNPGAGAHHWLLAGYGTTQFGPWDNSIGQVSPALPVGQWFHLATTFDGSMLRVYVNGAVAASTLSGFNLQGLPLTLAQGHAFEYNFKGLFDEVRLWNVARSTEQVLEFMNRRATGTEAGLVLYYRFDEGAGTVAADTAGRGNVGTLVGNPAWVVSGAQIGRPFATTALPTDITTTSARLRGTVNPNELPTWAWFEWGSTTSHERQTVPRDLGHGAQAQELAESLTNLLPNTSYRYRAMASNSAAQVAGLEQSFVTGTGNRALVFDGVDDYLLTSDLLPAMTNETLTLEFWLKADAPGMLVSERVAAMGWYESHMELHPDGQVAVHVNSVPTISLGRISLGTWHHVALRYDKATLTLDGFLDGTPSLQRAAGDWWACFEFGAVSVGWGFRLFLSHGFTAEPGARAFFNGQLDEVRIWNTARTEDEIQIYMNGGLVGSEAGLVAYYRCDEGSGTVVRDATSRGLDAGLSNGPAWVVSEALGRPRCITGSAHEITTRSARVRGALHPESWATTAWLEWGTTTNYGCVTNFQDVGSTLEPVVLSYALTDLLPDTVYHYRWVATNVSSRLEGREAQFQTAGPPRPSSLAASLRANTAQLNASVIPNGQATAAWFEWGTNTSYANLTAVMNLGDSFQATNLSASLDGLAPELITM